MEETQITYAAISLFIWKIVNKLMHEGRSENCVSFVKICINTCNWKIIIVYCCPKGNKPKAD